MLKNDAFALALSNCSLLIRSNILCKSNQALTVSMSVFILFLLLDRIGGELRQEEEGDMSYSMIQQS